MGRSYRIFTDGSVLGNPGPGGWGAVLMQGSKCWEMSGCSPWTTISEMEILAAARTLSSLPSTSKVELLSDSALLIYGMRAFVFRWQKQGWRNRRGEQLQHRELWLELIHLNQQLKIDWKWVRGHNGHPHQCRADAIAYREAQSAICATAIAA